MATYTPDPLIKNLIHKVKYLLEWMPICSEGSSGWLRRRDVELGISLIEAADKNEQFELDHLPEGSH